MNSSEPAKVIASIFALAAFAVAIVAGLAAQNSAARVLGTAVAAMVVCHVVGLCIGAIGESVLTEHLSRDKTGSASSEHQAQASAPAAAVQTG